MSMEIKKFFIILLEIVSFDVVKVYEKLLVHGIFVQSSYCYWLASVVVHCASCSVCCPLIYSSQELLDQSLPNLVCSICRVRRQEIVRGGNHVTGVC